MMEKPFPGACMFPHFPSQLKIEPVYGCDKRCPFCTLANAITDLKDITYMDGTLYEKIVKECDGKDLKKIGYGVHGEPTMHPEFLSMIKQMRIAVPSSVITTATNGRELRKRGDASFLLDLMAAGCNNIILDAYESQTYEIFCKDQNRIMQVAEVHSGDDTSAFRQRKGNHIVVNNPKVAMFDQQRKNKTLNTMGTSMRYEVWQKYGINPGQFPVEKPCAELHQYMTIKADGKVPVCCADGSRSMFIGDVNENSIKEIWTGRNADVMRWALVRRLRGLLLPCYACHRVSSRAGLWPHWGKEYTKDEIKEVVRKIAKPSKHWMKNMKALHQEKETWDFMYEILMANWNILEKDQ